MQGGEDQVHVVVAGFYKATISINLIVITRSTSRLPQELEIISV